MLVRILPPVSLSPSYFTCYILEFKDEVPVTVYNNFNGNIVKDGDYKKISMYKSKS